MGAGIFCIIIGVVLIILTLTGMSLEKATTYSIGAVFFVVGVLLIIFELVQFDKGSAYTVCLGAAAAFLWAGFHNVSKKLKCDKKIEATYLGCTGYSSGNGKKYTPNFQFRVNNKNYTNNSGEVFSKRYLDKRYTIGNKYFIYVNSKDNHEYITKRSLSLSDLNLLILGIGSILIAVYLI